MVLIESCSAMFMVAVIEYVILPKGVVDVPGVFTGTAMENGTLIVPAFQRPQSDELGQHGMLFH